MKNLYVSVSVTAVPLVIYIDCTFQCERHILIWLKITNISFHLCDENVGLFLLIWFYWHHSADDCRRRAFIVI